MNFKKGPWLNLYIQNIYENIDKGTNRQLYEAITIAVDRVLQDPTSRDFSKHTINPYKAVDVLAQVRLFFIIENQYDLVFFVWINDPIKFPHDSSRGLNDKCYKEFKRLRENERLDVYTHKNEPEPNFSMKGSFRVNEEIYSSLSIDSQFASSSLVLSKKNSNEYFIEHICESEFNSNALKILINKVCSIAVENKINLICKLEQYRSPDYIKSIMTTLKNSHFEILEANNEYFLFKFSLKSKSKIK